MEFYDLELKLKSYLSKNNIRLCDPPYTVDNQPGTELKSLSKKFSDEINTDPIETENVLNHLRIKSLSNIKSIGKFKTENIVTIKIHEPKSIDDIVLELLYFDQATGYTLKSEISEKISISNCFIKLIFRGKLIVDDDLLWNQGLRNNCRVILLRMTEGNANIRRGYADFTRTRDMAQYLANRSIDGRFKSDTMDIEITNQSGAVVHLTKDQKSLLTYGLTMHQQALGFISENQYQIGLLHCLEADEAFNKSQYCDHIDNAAILQLDIVWCYYSLQNIDDLENAKERLKVCEERMRKCYGEENERIRKIREKSSFEGIPESVQMFRLYLLKSVVAYYENDSEISQKYLLKAAEVYDSFVIPDSLIVQVMEFGFTRDEAIEGLRVNRDINSCVDFIFRRRTDKENLKLQDKQVFQRKIISKRLGHTENKERINLDVLEKLIDGSGMNPKLCLAAIRRANNNFLDSMELLFNNEDQLLQDIELQKEKGLAVDGDITFECVLRENKSIKYIKQITNQDKSIITMVLRQCDGIVEMAVNKLLSDQYSSSSSTSSSSLGTSKNSDTDDIENMIYEKVGKNCEKSENQYTNPKLSNEISAFNKFAKLLNVNEIVEYEERHF